jgi:hypothetical protein
MLDALTLDQLRTFIAAGGACAHSGEIRGV